MYHLMVMCKYIWCIYIVLYKQFFCTSANCDIGEG